MKFPAAPLLAAVIFAMLNVFYNSPATADSYSDKRSQTARIADRTYYIPWHNNSIRPIYLAAGGNGFEVGSSLPRFGGKYRIEPFYWSLQGLGPQARVCRTAPRTYDRRPVRICYPYREFLRVRSVPGDPLKMRSRRITPELEKLIKFRK